MRRALHHGSRRQTLARRSGRAKRQATEATGRPRNKKNGPQIGGRNGRWSKTKNGAAEGTRTPAYSLASCRTTPILRPLGADLFLLHAAAAATRPRSSAEPAA